MPECPRLWTNLSDEEFAMDIGFTKTEKQFSTFACPLTNVGGHAVIGSCPSANVGGHHAIVSCPSANVEGHAAIVSCPSANVGGHLTSESCPSTNVGGHTTIESCPSTNVGGHAAIGSCPSTNIGAQFPAESCTSANVEEHATIGKEELHFRIHRLFCHRVLCRASRCSMQEEKALCRPSEYHIPLNTHPFSKLQLIHSPNFLKKYCP